MRETLFFCLDSVIVVLSNRLTLPRIYENKILICIPPPADDVTPERFSMVEWVAVVGKHANPDFICILVNDVTIVILICMPPFLNGVLIAVIKLYSSHANEVTGQLSKWSNVLITDEKELWRHNGPNRTLLIDRRLSSPPSLKMMQMSSMWHRAVTSRHGSWLAVSRSVMTSQWYHHGYWLVVFISTEQWIAPRECPGVPDDATWLHEDLMETFWDLYDW